MIRSRRCIVALALLAAALPAFLRAQDDPAFRRWQEQEQKKFQEFRDRNDREFFEFLKKEWRGVELARGMVRDPIPDPVTQPVCTAPPAPANIPPVPSPAVAIPTAPERGEPAPPIPERAQAAPGGVNVTFFGARLSLPLDPTLRVELHGDLEKESISDFFAGLSRSKYAELIAAARAIRTERRLNDWGYCRLLSAIAVKMYGRQGNESTLFVWYMLIKSGYDARVGYANSRAVLLLPTDGRLYGIPYFSFQTAGRRYYAVALDPAVPVTAGQLHAYDGTYAGATNPMTFAVPDIPVLTTEVASKTLRFAYAGKDYALPVRFSRDAVAFFEYYPQADFDVYFDGSVSADAAASLYSALQPLIAGRTEVEAVNILLRFSQTAFGYKVDQELFGREKPMFPDEVLFYDNSNCKDRAVLFAWLVRRLTGLDVIGLNYPGHVSTAVRFTQEIPGDSVEFQKGKYVICDPTYINADAGMCMPQFRSVTPVIIRLRRHV